MEKDHEVKENNKITNRFKNMETNQLFFNYRKYLIHFAKLQGLIYNLL